MDFEEGGLRHLFSSHQNLKKSTQIIVQTFCALKILNYDLFDSLMGYDLFFGF